MRKVDFICIGATKAGTTSFYHYIKSHPELYLPPTKELHFFDDETEYKQGWESFFKRNFSGAKSSQSIGYQSPRYLRDPGVARKIFELSPDVRLFIILRNPIYRAFSHYKMLFRLQREKRTFTQLIDDQLREQNLEACRTSPLEGEFSLLTQGEYGRILEGYLKYFRQDQILVLFSEELESNPQSCLDSFCDFIAVPRFSPSNLNQKYHVGGDTARFIWLIPFLKKLYFPQLIWKMLKSDTRGKIILWNNTKLKVSPKQRTAIQQHEIEKLKAFYYDDVKLLERLFGLKTPWVTFR